MTTTLYVLDSNCLMTLSWNLVVVLKAVTGFDGVFVENLVQSHSVQGVVIYIYIYIIFKQMGCQDICGCACAPCAHARNVPADLCVKDVDLPQDLLVFTRISYYLQMRFVDLWKEWTPRRS